MDSHAHKILRAENISKTFHHGGSRIQALHEISLDVFEGEILGVVGESGSGKSTLAKLLIGLMHPSSGEVFLDHHSLGKYSRLDRARLIQMVFQDWQSSLNPKMKVSQILSEPWQIHRKSAPNDFENALLRITEIFTLDHDILNRTSQSLSGGQLQRVSIARALVLNPKILIADEPTSSLDIPLRRQILELLKNKTKELHLTLVIISHDLEAVLSLATRIIVMYRGKIVEMMDPTQIRKKAIHPYTSRLTSSQSSSLDSLWDEMDQDFSWERQCPFVNVCANVMKICHEKMPVWKNHGDTHGALCHV